MVLDQVVYGNPTVEQLKDISKKTYLDTLFPELATFNPPKNSSEATKEELNELVEYTTDLALRDEYLHRYKVYDRGLISYFKKGLTKDGVPHEEMISLIDEIISDTMPLLFKLKYHFQRPRPNQLAAYYKLNLFPYKSVSSDSPSFPSGHAFHGKILTEVLGNRYPEIYGYLTMLFNELCYSRLYMGLHYASDIDVGIFAAERVLSLKEFKTKYKL